MYPNIVKWPFKFSVDDLTSTYKSFDVNIVSSDVYAPKANTKLSRIVYTLVPWNSYNNVETISYVNGYSLVYKYDCPSLIKAKLYHTLCRLKSFSVDATSYNMVYNVQFTNGAFLSKEILNWCNDNHIALFNNCVSEEDKELYRMKWNNTDLLDY